MSVRHSEEHLANLAAPGNICTICNDETTNFNFVATPCSHGFHRSCLSTWLTENDSCPLCRRSIDSQSLRSFSEQDLRPAPENASSQGAVSRAPNANSRGRRITRSRAAHNNNLDRSNLDESHSPANTRGSRSHRNNREDQRQSNFDLQRVQQMIEETTQRQRVAMTREITEVVSQLVSQSLETRLQNLNINNERNERDEQRPEWQQNEILHSPGGTYRSAAQEGVNLNSSRNLNIPNVHNINNNNGSARNTQNLSPEAISKIIVNWKLTFDGSPENVSVDEFIYR
ncbi:PREDICTED: E3 ubiquitin-protein ligase ATL9-like, partial [Rhagoletis zephyria]|uniref:E3 ubiquitin-protein ligase ATL9-like n=1 Tax=Rhagoletis zephyria TaxID=28612 RepID=UPI0008112B19